MIYCFDLDGTLCKERLTFEKSLAQPITKNIEMCNELYRQDNRIIIFTSRGWAEYLMTQKWLDDNEVLYHLLICGKPIYDRWIDDRAINVEDFSI